MLMEVNLLFKRTTNEIIFFVSCSVMPKNCAKVSRVHNFFWDTEGCMTIANRSRFIRFYDKQLKTTKLSEFPTYFPKSFAFSFPSHEVTLVALLTSDRTWI